VLHSLLLRLSLKLLLNYYYFYTPLSIYIYRERDLGGRQVGLRGSSSCGGMFPCLGDHMILSQIGFLRGLRRKLVMVSWHLLSSNLGIVESTLGCNTWGFYMSRSSVIIRWGIWGIGWMRIGGGTYYRGESFLFGRRAFLDNLFGAFNYYHISNIIDTWV
jgi:hypothetical protein